jgi:hypothetical protein
LVPCIILIESRSSWLVRLFNKTAALVMGAASSGEPLLSDQGMEGSSYR